MKKNKKRRSIIRSREKKGFKKTKLGWIPEDWENTQLKKVIERIEGGGTPSKANKGFWNGNIHWASVKDFTNFDPYKTKNKITKQGLENSSSKLIAAGTIIIPTRMALGKAVIFDIDVAINQDLKALFPKSILSNDFLLQWFYSKSRFIEALGNGSTVKGITLTDLGLIKIKLPPLPEQKAIANCLSTGDTAITKLDSLIKAKQQLKKALMQQLLSGKKRLPGFDGEWEEKRLDYFFDERSERNNSEDLELLSIGEAGVYPQDNSNKKDTSNSDKSKYKKICVGDIGYNTMRMWQGRSALSSLEGIVSPAYTIVKPKANTDSRFFAYLFKDLAVIHRFYRNSQGMVSDTLNCKFKDFSIIKLVHQ